MKKLIYALSLLFVAGSIYSQANLEVEGKAKIIAHKRAYWALMHWCDGGLFDV